MWNNEKERNKTKRQKTRWSYEENKERKYKTWNLYWGGVKMPCGKKSIKGKGGRRK